MGRGHISSVLGDPHSVCGCSGGQKGLSLCRLLQHLLAQATACLALRGLARRQGAKEAITAGQVAVTHWDVIFRLALGPCRQLRGLAIDIPVNVGVLGGLVPSLLELGRCQLFRDISQCSWLGSQYSSWLRVLLGGSCCSRCMTVYAGCLQSFFDILQTLLSLVGQPLQPAKSLASSLLLIQTIHPTTLD